MFCKFVMEIQGINTLKLTFMASIRRLKKSIQSITGELFTEGLFIQCITETNDPDKINETLTKIIEKQNDFLTRANHPDGTKNKKITKEYYRNLISDINTHINEIMTDLYAAQKK